jgi:hypothetical protein
MEPDKKTVLIPVWDLCTDEIIEMEVDEECLLEMDRAAEEMRQRRERAWEEERDAWEYAHDE